VEAAKRSRGPNQGPLVAALRATLDGFGSNGLDREARRSLQLLFLLALMLLLLSRMRLCAAVAAHKSFKVSTHGCGTSNIVNERIIEEGRVAKAWPRCTSDVLVEGGNQRLALLVRE